MEHLKDHALNDIPPVLLGGEWVDVGHDSAIRLDAISGSILHRCNGKIRKHSIDWLVAELPLLNWILHRSQKNVDLQCQLV